jgi:hypothetical protein
LKLAKINSVTADLRADVPLPGSTAKALPTALNFAIARAAIAILEVLIVALVVAKVESITTDFIAGSRGRSRADESCLNSAMVVATKRRLDYAY